MAYKTLKKLNSELISFQQRMAGDQISFSVNGISAIQDRILPKTNPEGPDPLIINMILVSSYVGGGPKVIDAFDVNNVPDEIADGILWNSKIAFDTEGMIVGFKIYGQYTDENFKMGRDNSMIHSEKNSVVDDFLMHYGIKGMKWKQRKDPADKYRLNDDGSLTDITPLTKDNVVKKTFEMQNRVKKILKNYIKDNVGGRRGVTIKGDTTNIKFSDGSMPKIKKKKIKGKGLGAGVIKGRAKN